MVRSSQRRRLEFTVKRSNTSVDLHTTLVGKRARSIRGRTLAQCSFCLTAALVAVGGGEEQGVAGGALLLAVSLTN